MGYTVDSGIKLTRAQVNTIKRAIKALHHVIGLLQATTTILEQCLPK